MHAKQNSHGIQTLKEKKWHICIKTQMIGTNQRIIKLKISRMTVHEEKHTKRNR